MAQLLGIDISNYQSVESVDIAPDFVIIKATEGTGYVNPLCDSQYQRAKAQGKLLGVYHFVRPDLGLSPEDEAQFFVDNCRGYIGEALLAIDYEVAPYSDDYAFRFAKKVAELTDGVWPLAYMSASKVTEYAWPQTCKACGLWIAGYPDLRASWDIPDFPYNTDEWTDGCAIWQYTDSYGQLDRDVAYMTKEAWHKFARPGENPKPEPQPTPAPTKKTNEQIADEVIAGKWGNGEERKQRLTAAGYDYNTIQGIVNTKMGVRPDDGFFWYTIQPGDTLSGIAARFGTTVGQIQVDNSILNPNLIYAGSTLKIRG